MVVKRTILLQISLLLLIWIDTIGCRHNQHWVAHKRRYGLSFKPNEESKRFKIFSKNLDFINKFNSKNTSSRVKLNEFAHMEKHEVFLPKKQKQSAHFKNTQNNYQPKIVNTTKFDQLPRYFNWANLYQSRVRQQGACGSCWAMAAITTLEYYYKIFHNLSISLSPQQLIDCGPPNMGCEGGDHNFAYYYARLFGIVEEKHYPYIEKKSSCQVDSLDVPLFKIMGHMVAGSNFQEFKYLLYSYGPLSVATTINSKSFLFYSDGVYNHTTCTNDPDDITHAAVLVGYGFDEKVNEDYLIIQNSWGDKWGINGFLKLSEKNLCGLTLLPAIPR